jgi:integrase/recombinase XerD
MRKWLEAFEQHVRQAKKMAPNTCESYVRDINGYLTFLERNGMKQIDGTTGNDVLAYVTSLETQGRSRATMARHLASIKAFYTFLWELGVVSKNPCSDISLPKEEVSTKRTVLTVTEIERLLTAPDPHTLTGQRDRAILELMYASGIRVSELVSLNVTDVNTTLGVITCTGTNGMERVIPLGKKASRVLDTYVNDTRPQLVNTASESALFVNRRGRRLTRQGFWKILKKCGELCGLTHKITPNALRRSFAAHMLDNGADLRVVQELMGHADLATTQRYASSDRGRVMDAYLRHHPRA